MEDIEDYQQKGGKLNEDDGEYEYEDKYQYDDKANYSEDIDEFETKKDDEIQYPIQDWCPQTRKNTFNDDGETTIPPPKKDEIEEQPIFPINFFFTDFLLRFFCDFFF